MKRILLLIHSAGHKIYQQNTKALIEGYNDIIREHELPVDISAFCGTCNDTEHSYVEDTISPIDEKKVCDVFFDIMLKSVNLENYDIIIKTNTNTVVNLPLICAFCNSINFRSDVVYTNIAYGMHDYDERYLVFPSGMFIMADRNLWKRIMEDYNPAFEYIKYIESIENHTGIKHDEDESNDKLVWTGYSDEFVTGVILRRLRIHLLLLKSSSISYWKTNFFREGISTGIFSDRICDNFASINCKLDIDCDLDFNSPDEMFRSQYEHLFISMICNMFKNYHPKINDINNLLCYGY